MASMLAGILVLGSAAELAALASNVACNSLSSCEECLAPQSGCFAWSGTECWGDSEATTAVQGDRNLYRNCSERRHVEELERNCSRVPGGDTCACLAAGCVAQEENADGSPTHGSCHIIDCGCPGNFRHAWCTDTFAHKPGGVYCQTQEQHCEANCRGTWCPASTGDVKTGCFATQQAGAGRIIADCAAAGAGRYGEGTRFCADSARQFCRRSCAEPRCPRGFCAMRIGRCCNYYCRRQGQ